ncbi:MAG: IclR family transcriptional regulator [Hydrogenophaga sp.]|nr:IclR family transcriptional regulator [Hydrogenophaga sp.]
MMPATMATRDKPPKKEVRVRAVPAVTRSIAILRLLGENKQGMGVKAIADALALVPSTCLHILRVLVSEELVRIDADTKRYTLGNGMIRLAKSVLEDGGFARLAQPALDRLAAAHGVTAMGVEITSRQSVVVLALSKSTQPFRLHTDVGSEFSSLVSATGRLMAAYSEETSAQLRKRFNTITWDKAPGFEAWKKEVDQARVRGWSIDRDNFVVGLTVVAVPLIDRTGRLTHTLVTAGLSSHFTASVVPRIVADMRREAQALMDLLV